jgi:hypothetical protein
LLGPRESGHGQASASQGLSGSSFCEKTTQLLLGATGRWVGLNCCFLGAWQVDPLRKKLLGCFLELGACTTDCFLEPSAGLAVQSGLPDYLHVSWGCGRMGRAFCLAERAGLVELLGAPAWVLHRTLRA